MAQDDLRTVIRELLAEELAKVRGAMKTASAAAHVRDEEVSIASDAELDAFVKRLLSLAKDDHARADIEAGRHRFRLRQGARRIPSAPAERLGTQNPAHFDKGIITERDIAKLPIGLAAVQIGKRVRFTPLAKDELRRRGIKIERTTS